MENISLPNQITSKEIEDNHAQIIISPCYPGYGTTIGNALRRVLLSSMPGAAITAVKIKGVDHEFSTMENVKEDVVEIILNLKNVRLKVHSEEPQEVELSAKGAKTVTAKDFKKNSEVEVVNPEQSIATLTAKDATMEMKIIVDKGRGYLPVENREKEKLDVGYIAVDAIYTPIKTVNFQTEHVRVGQLTNYDKLILDIVTDGSITPEEVFKMSNELLVDHFKLLFDQNFDVKEEIIEEKSLDKLETKKEEDESPKEA